MAGDVTLAGLHVIVTRPRAQAGELSAALRAAGAVVSVFPVLEIQALEPAPIRAHELRAVAAVICVSRNAAKLGITWLGRQCAARPVCWSWFAVGPATARELHAHGIRASVPRQHDSEGLLAMPELAAFDTSASVLLLRGEGGRDVIASTLRARGHKVLEAALYRRACPRVEPPEIQRMVAAADTPVVLITSADAFDNLLAILGPEHTPWLWRHTRLAAVSGRIAAHIKAVAARGGEAAAQPEPLVLPGASVQAILDGLRQNSARQDPGERH